MKKTSDNDLPLIKKEHSDLLLGMHVNKNTPITGKQIYINIKKDTTVTYEFLENLILSFVNSFSATIDYSDIIVITGEYLTHFLNNEGKITQDEIQNLNVIKYYLKFTSLYF
jgi:hypothetical protein